MHITIPADFAEAVSHIIRGTTPYEGVEANLIIDGAGFIGRNGIIEDKHSEIRAIWDLNSPEWGKFAQPGVLDDILIRLKHPGNPGGTVEVEDWAESGHLKGA